MTTVIGIAPRVVPRRPLTVTGVWLTILLFYAIALPKGGIKAAGVPLTIGYVLTVLLMATALLRSSGLSVSLDRLLAFAPCALLGLWSALLVRFNGTESVGFTISYFVSVLYLPLFGLVFFSPLILDDHGDRIERTIVWAIRFVIVYGIFLFVYKQATGKWIEIPLVTVNAADVGQLDDKYINRGGVFKLISTYNNGNIFGVSIATIAPIYLRLENKRFMSWLLYAALFLTLSRTVWIATIIVIVVRSLSKGIRPLSLLYLAIGLLVAGATVVGLLDAIGVDMSFLVDSNLGGRASQLDYLNDVRIIPQEPVDALPEIVYLGIIRYFGLLGLLLFVAHLVAPSVILHLQKVRLFSERKASACLQGLLIYTIIAGADAAFSFIPVMMVFWMVAGLGFWYAHREMAAVRGVCETSR